MKPELIADYQCATGEGPLWHPLEQKLYWLDIPKGRIFRYDPATGRHEPFYQASEAIGGYTFQADGGLLLFMARGAVKMLREGRLTTVIEEISEERGSRFNDVIADPTGRVFCGTMPSPDHLGALYRLDTNGTLTRVFDNIATSNGMGFTRDLQRMYHTETRKLLIYLLDYEPRTGALTNRRDFARVPEGEGKPDGLAVDAEGCVWSARWEGGCVVRYTPDGREERRIAFPARKVSSLTFGGSGYTDIYVTTAGGDNRAAEGPGAGALFRLNLGIRGVPPFLSRIRC